MKCCRMCKLLFYTNLAHVILGYITSTTLSGHKKNITYKSAWTSNIVWQNTNMYGFFSQAFWQKPLFNAYNALGEMLLES